VNKSLVKLGLMLLFFFTFPVSILADSGDKGFKQTVGDYEVELVFPAGQPQTGRNEVVIELFDRHGQPLEPTAVTVDIVRPDSTSVDAHVETDSPHQPPGSNSHQAGESDPHPVKADPHAAEPADDHLDAEAGHQAAHDHAAPETNIDRHGGAGHGEVEAATHDDVAATKSAQAGHDESSAGGGHHAETGPATLTAGPQAGEYTGQLEFADTGAWLVTVNFEAAGDVKEATFTVEAARNGSVWLVINSFMAVNALVIAAAAVTKKFSIQTKTRKGIA
jgi:hypothetical protein